jgi:putative FmdB family regulatory protein
MPLYDFSCVKCGRLFTVLVPWREKKDTTCPACGSKELDERWGSFSTPGCVTGDSYG